MGLRFSCVLFQVVWLNGSGCNVCNPACCPDSHVQVNAVLSTAQILQPCRNMIMSSKDNVHATSYWPEHSKRFKRLQGFWNSEVGVCRTLDASRISDLFCRLVNLFRKRQYTASWFLMCLNTWAGQPRAVFSGPGFWYPCVPFPGPNSSANFKP